MLQNTVEHFKTQQTKSLELFERFLSEQNQQSQQLISMLSQQLGSTNTANQIATTKPSNGNGNGQAYVASKATPTFPPVVEERVAIEAKPIVETPKVAVTQLATHNPQLTTGKLENILLTVISEKTGYPTEMLELSMDMEADLGIDSIKRVEIFGAMTEDYPEVNGINPNDLTELRTLQQIVDYLAQTGKKKVLV